MKTNLSLVQVQKQILAPAMQQSIAILLLPIAELTTAIEQELQENPLLELDEEKNFLHQPPQSVNSQPKIENKNIISDQPSNENWSNDFIDEETERIITRDLTLEDSLLQQLRCEISDPLKFRIGELLIGSLDEDGYLQVNFQEIAESLGIADLSLIEEILKIIQSFDPMGIASRDLKECLMIQMKAKYNGTSHLGCQIIQQHLEDLGLRKYQKIAKNLGTTTAEAEKTAKMIASLDPRPARNYRPIAAEIYIKPDVTIQKNRQNEYEIQINRAGVPYIRVNSYYKNLLTQSNLTDEEKNFIREKIKNAQNFIRSLEQRGQTLHAIADYILQRQKDFFEGALFAIVPMSLKDVAQIIGRNESTVSRAIHNKYIDTPQGIFPAKFFFSQAIVSDQSDCVSSRGVKEEIKELIETEDKTSPLSDQEIQNYFHRKGMTLARRTVTKYRQSLKILPSHLRRIDSPNPPKTRNFEPVINRG